MSALQTPLGDSHIQSKAGKLRQLMAGADPVLTIGAHSGLGARLGEEAGFDAVWASGLELSAAAGLPDANILSMRDFLDAARQINRATTLPVICDCDTGFGNALNVMHVVREYESAGIAGICIEDKVFPKINSFITSASQRLVSVEEFAGKIEAAKHAQQTREFVIIARVEALIAGAGLSEALRRAQAYVDAGADSILIHSKKDNPDEILEFFAHWDHPIPMTVVPTTYPQISADALHDAKAKILIYANHGLRAAIQHMSDVFAEIIRERGTHTVEDKIASVQRIFELQDMGTFKDYEARFVRSP